MEASADLTVVLVCADSAQRALLFAQLELMGLRGCIVAAEGIESALDLVSGSVPTLCVYRVSDQDDDCVAYLEAKPRLGHFRIVLGPPRNAHLFASDHFVTVPYSFHALQEAVRGTVLPKQVDYALRRGSDPASGDQERIYRDLFDRGGDANLVLDFDTHIIIDANQRA